LRTIQEIVEMASATPKQSEKGKRSTGGAGRLARAALTGQARAFAHAMVIEEARAAGLLQGDKSEHVSFRAPPALIEAAKREAGVSSTTELGLLALALLAQPDPVVSAMRRTRGRLGPDHQLEY
jgi:hypothetical protein